MGLEKNRLVVLVFLAIVMLSASVFAVSDVAYIYSKNYKVDNNILDVFSELNLTVDLININSMPSSFANYRFIFVGDENFRKTVPVNTYPSVVTNYYHGDTWGLTDNEGVSQLGANSPLKVNKNGSIIQVYTTAKDNRGVSIPYYYLGDEDKANAMVKIAGTYAAASGSDIGDVISYAQKGANLENGKRANGKICFFGIVESDYWTPAARNMFADCVGFVSAVCSQNSECPANSTSQLFCMDDDVYQNSTSYSCFNPGKSNAQCLGNVQSNLIEQCDDYCSNGQCFDFECEIDLDCNDGNNYTQDICNNASTPTSYCSNDPIECLSDIDCGISGPDGNAYCINSNVSQNYTIYTCNNPGTVQSFCSVANITNTSEMCEFGCSNGLCLNAQCSDSIDNDGDNFVDISDPGCHSDGNPFNDSSYDPNDNNETNIPIVCSANIDCGTTQIGPNYCSLNNVTQNITSYTCNNPGTTSSFCSSANSTNVVEMCEFGCSNGQCLGPVCGNNITETGEQCDDGDLDNNDGCSSICEIETIDCFDDIDCGNSAYTGNQFCTGNNVSQNYTEYICNNPGTYSSYCSVDTDPEVIEQCDDYCSNGTCQQFECEIDLDCDDNNPLTLDQCINPGTIVSDCRNTPINCNNDLDCGSTGFTGLEYCSVDDDVFKNYQNSTCINPGTTSSYCTLSVSSVMINQCANACADGGCIVCDENLDCDDNNSNTLDICNNPGTVQSFCSNGNIPVCGNSVVEQGEQCDDGNLNNNDSCSNSCQIQNIECDSELDCGIDGFLGNEYCSNDDVAQDYIDYTCNNPGTSGSFCSSNTSVEIIDICSNGCSNGQCIGSFECSDGNDNDGDNLVDILDPGCHSDGNPNNPGSYNPSDNDENDNGVECSVNSDCGTDGYNGDPVCSGNNVVQGYTSYVCNNPGTTSSYCSSNTNNNIIESCSISCSDGQCVQDKCAAGLGFDSGWQQFTDNIGSCPVDSAGGYCGPSCRTQGGYCGCKASGYDLSWIRTAPQCTGSNGDYTFLCGGGSCNLMSGMGMGQTTDIPESGWYYISVDAEWDSGNTPENLFIGANEPYGGLYNRIAVKDFSTSIKCITKAGQVYLNSDPAKIWVDTSLNSGSVHVSNFRVSECIPDDIKFYCDGTRI